jgi:hypothetical protein
MHHAERLLLVDSQGLRRAYRILDLSPVEVMLGEVVEVRVAEGHRGRAFEDAHFLNEHLEDSFLGLGRELAVAESDVDTRLEGVVEGLGRELVGFFCNFSAGGTGGTYLDAVGGQEKDALEVLEQAEEDAHERVAVDILDRALLEEDIRLVK